MLSSFSPQFRSLFDIPREPLKGPNTHTHSFLWDFYNPRTVCGPGPDKNYPGWMKTRSTPGSSLSAGIQKRGYPWLQFRWKQCFQAFVPGNQSLAAERRELNEKTKYLPQRGQPQGSRVLLSGRVPSLRLCNRAPGLRFTNSSLLTLALDTL